MCSVLLTACLFCSLFCGVNKIVLGGSQYSSLGKIVCLGDSSLECSEVFADFGKCSYFQSFHLQFLKFQSQFFG